MGCSSSSCDDNAPEALALCKYRELREHRGPGYLTQDPTSLNDYKLLLNQMGAASSDDEEVDDDPLRRSRDITVVSNRSSDSSSTSIRRLRSAIRTNSRVRTFDESSEGSSRSACGITPSMSFLGTSHDLKRVSFDENPMDDLWQSASPSSMTSQRHQGCSNSTATTEPCVALPHAVPE